MPIAIQHIDQISRAVQRDVLYLGFPEKRGRHTRYNRQSPQRDAAIEWLKEQEITYAPCALEASEHRMVSYQGHLYVDVPYDPSHPGCAALLAQFEQPDGTPKDPACGIYLYRHEKALKNAHHDEPGFWEKHSQSF